MIPPTEPPDGGEARSDGPPELPGSSRLLLWSSVLAFLPVALVLSAAGLGIGHSLWVTGLLVLLPGLALAQVPLARDEPVEREPVYVASGLFLFLLGGTTWLVGSGTPGARAMGLLPFLHTGPLLGWAGGIVLAAGAVTLGFHVLGRILDVPESPLLARLLPRTPREQGLFAVLSVAAGVGEELAYRGYAIPILAPLLGSSWGAAAVTSGVFGALHAYQGPLGVFRTTLLGFVLAAGFLLSGSLWPGIVAHATIDLLGGLVLGDRLLRRP